MTWYNFSSMRISLFPLHWVIMVISRAVRNRSLQQFWRHVTPPDTEPEASFIILDGSALINALPLRISKTFEEYAVLEIVPKVQVYSCTYMRRYCVWHILVCLPAVMSYPWQRGKEFMANIKCMACMTCLVPLIVLMKQDWKCLPESRSYDSSPSHNVSSSHSTY